MSYFALPFAPALSLAGAVAPSAKLYFYLTGTSTPATVYADADLSTPLSNPVIASSAGRFEDIYLDDAVSYRVRLTSSLGAVLGEADPVQGGGYASGLFEGQLAEADGSDRVGYQYAADSIEKTVQGAVRARRLQLNDYCTGDGSNEATGFGKVVAKVNSFTDGGAADVGRMTVLSNSAHTFTRSASITGDGQQSSALRFGTSGGIVFSGGDKDEFDGKSFALEGVAIETSGINTGAVVTVDFNAVGTTLIPGFTARDVKISGKDGASGFDTGVSIVNPSFPTLDNVHALGDRGGSNLSNTGFSITGEGGSVLAFRSRAYFVRDGFIDDGNMEGNQYAFCELVALQRGITVEAEDGTFQPLRQVVNSHINAEEHCISFKGITEFLVSGCVLYGQGRLGTATQWTGLNIDPGTYASAWTMNGMVRDTMFMGDGAFAATSVGINILGNTSAAEVVTIKGNTFQSLDYGIYLGANTNGVWVTADNQFNNCTVNIFNAGNNLIQAGGYEYTVAALPTGLGTTMRGQEVNVSDLTANTFGAAPAGGGAVKGKVRWTGAAWVIC